nr:MAG TPA: hypothetical protein [Caudoviricetes sp.]
MKRRNAFFFLSPRVKRGAAAHAMRRRHNVPVMVRHMLASSIGN